MVLATTNYQSSQGTLYWDEPENRYIKLPYGTTAPPINPARPTPLMRLCAPATPTTAPEFRGIDFRNFSSKIFDSKYFMYRLGHNGPIDSPRFITSFQETDEPKFNLQKFARENVDRIEDARSKIFFTRLADENAIWCRGKRQEQTHPEHIRKTFSERKIFIEQILKGHWDNKEITFKPNFAADASGVTFISCKPEDVKFTCFDNSPYGAAGYLPAYLKLYPDDFNFTPEGKILKFRMLKNERSAQHLNFILDMMSLQDKGSVEARYPIGALKPYFELDNGMVQYKEDLLLTRKMRTVEGRYKFDIDSEGEISLQKNLDINKNIGSYLKIGTNSSFVNRGKSLPWTVMHKALLKLTDCKVNKEQYDIYMENLIKSQVLHYLQVLQDHGYKNECQGGEIDIAWHATDKDMVQLPDGTKIQVPRPILIESHLYMPNIESAPPKILDDDNSGTSLLW